MSEQEMKVVIDQNIEQFYAVKKVYNLQYTMDFDNVSILYEFCLN